MDVLRLIRTLRYIPPHAVVWRVWARLKRQYYKLPMYGVRGVWQPEGVLPPLRWVGIEIVPGNVARGMALADGKWLLAGQELALGIPPRSWAPERLQALQLFEMHYHEWLADLRAAGQADTARTLLTDWLLQFAHYNALAWHPYPTSLRVVAWLTHGGWLLGEADEAFKTAFHEALHAQLNYLRYNCEWDLGGNHLVKNLKALLLGALARDDGATMQWAEGQLIKALQHQILPDGAHDERTPHYHAQVLQDVLEVRAALRANGYSGGGVWDVWVGQMTKALAFYTYPDSTLGLWNDGVVGDAERIEALLGYGDNTAPHSLKDAGYARLNLDMGAGKGKTAWWVMFDAGKVGPDENPGHAHADVLAFEWGVGTGSAAQRVVVNQGTLAYQHPLRRALRGTAAHSTLQIEASDSAEVWGSHRVGRRPKTVLLEEREAGRHVAGSHDGYRHLGISHKRVLQLEEGVLQGHDFIGGKWNPTQRMWVRFHLHPAIQVRQLSEQLAELVLPSGEVLQFACLGGRLTVQPSRYAPHWNALQQSQQLAIRVQQPEVSWRFTYKS